MTNDEIRIEIGEMLNRTPDWYCSQCRTIVKNVVRRRQGWVHDDCPQVVQGLCDPSFPNYPESLDDCREFEASLKDVTHSSNPGDYETWQYAILLCESAGLNYNSDKAFAHFKIATATPLQRCEAFLRLKGKWRE